MKSKGQAIPQYSGRTSCSLLSICSTSHLSFSSLYQCPAHPVPLSLPKDMNWNRNNPMRSWRRPTHRYSYYCSSCGYLRSNHSVPPPHSGRKSLLDRHGKKFIRIDRTLLTEAGAKAAALPARRAKMADFILMLLGCYEQTTRDIGGPGSSGAPIASRRGRRQAESRRHRG